MAELKIEKRHQWSKGFGNEKKARFFSEVGGDSWRCWRPNCPGLLGTVEVVEGYRMHRDAKTGTRTKVWERDVFIRLDSFKLVLKDGRKFWERRTDAKKKNLIDSFPVLVACHCCNELSYIPSVRDSA